ncbi:Thioesterase/thiol ester dehydrase-isomerase [Lasiodiplodia theobromae]|uniref:Thioesterase/thiol ester dehydrase-isomerase n=1 Tax=Lasiodiplodia theobromae TaxID=45133 RepID=UPI0015C3973B|nr:Thioesterase/thiol ester dehydrase-isomerase [Lasiodiplodia theobromae]KAF4535051.1 Thioesterase/thiol ester dehydrase-isomerase [Lasiodiplodia theobromae]
MPEPLIPLDPDGKDFAELMAVKRLDENTFRSIAKPCPNVTKPINGTMHHTTFGGHVYAQSAWAAAQTVGEGFLIHNTSGYFIGPGFSAFPFIYKILRIRDGKYFAARSVTVTQPSSPFPDSIVFTALISFKVPESLASKLLSYQNTSHPPPLTSFADILSATHPRDLPVKKYNDLASVILENSMQPCRSPSMSGIWWAQLPYTHRETLGAPAAEHWDPRPAARRSANPYTVSGNVSLGGANSTARSINLSICVHIFASDRESLFFASRHLGVHARVLTPAAAITSLSHTVVLHEVGDAVTFPDAVVAGTRRKEKERRFCQEVFTDRWADGRVLVHGKIYDVDTGVHVATTMQEGILKPDLKYDNEGVETLRNALLTGAVSRRPRGISKM